MTTDQTGAVGYYCTVKRGSKTGYLLGPYDTKPEAESHTKEARDLAAQVDAFTAFDEFGVTRVHMTRGRKLPPGVLNARAAQN